MITINLLPWREERKLYRNRRLQAILVIAALSALTIVMFYYLILKIQVSKQQGRNRYINNQIRVESNLFNKYKNVKEERDSLTNKIDIINKLYTVKPYSVKLLAGIANSAPDGISLTQISRKDAEITIAGVTNANEAIATFIRNLNKLNWLKDANLGEISNQDDIGFEIKLLDQSIIQFNQDE